MFKGMAAALAALALTPTAWAAPTAMNLMEKSAHKLAALAAKKQIDSSFATDVNAVSIQAGPAGTEFVLQSPSADPQVMNTLTLKFDSTGAFQSFTADFKSKSAQSPVFRAADASTLLDLGSEAVVDHLNESADLPVVAATAQSVNLANEGSAVHMRIVLKDGRTYSVMMDRNGKVVSKGF